MSKARGLADLGNVYDDGALSNRSLIINGAMTISQRGTSVTSATSTGYSTVDRWAHNASGATLNMSQQALTLGQTDIPSSFKNFFRVNATTGNNNAGVWQKVEGVDRVQGTVTLSFYAKGTNPSAGNFEIEFDQYFGSSGSGSGTVLETFTVTSSWQRFTKTITVPSLSGGSIGGGNDYFRVYFRQANADTGTSAWTLDITGVQLEVGDTATPFEHRSYGDELARCQRYYYLGKSRKNACQYHPSYRSIQYQFPVEMRALPTVMQVTATSAYSGINNQETDSWTGYIARDSTSTIFEYADEITFDAEL